MKAFKIQSKDLRNMKIVINYLNFVFYTEVKTKFKYNNLSFVFQFMKTGNRAGPLILIIENIILQLF